MKVLGNLSIVKTLDPNMPFGSTIQNENDIQEGTPVVAEFLADPINNLYRLVELAKITPTNDFDDDNEGYQIVEALKKLPNSMNDIEQVLSLTGAVWSVDLDLTILPNKYFFFAKASENYTAGMSYTFKGTTIDSYSFSSSGFSTGDLLIVIVNTSGVVAYSIVSSVATNNSFPTLGNALAFNSSSEMYYQEEGVFFTDIPSIADIQSVIQDEYGDTSLIVNDMFLIKDKLLCFCLIPGSNDYFFRQLDITDLTVSTLVSLVGTSFNDASDFSPYVYATKGFLYVTNNMNNDNDDFNITKLTYNLSASTLTLVSSLDLNNTFVKTTNAAIKSNLIYTIVSGQINSFNLASGAKVFLGNYPINAGQLFGFNGAIYYSVGGVATKWF